MLLKKKRGERMPTGNEVEVTFCLTDGTKLTRIETIDDITTFLEQHEEYVKIVRCKDCKRWEKDEMNYKYGWCGVFEVMKYENGYCDEGKRR